MRTSTHRRAAWARRWMMAAGPALVAALLVTPLVAAERMSDKAVRDLIVRIDNERDRFEDHLDGKFKHSIVRGDKGEVDVEHYLDDLQENVKKLEDRFKGEYAASAEVTTVLRQGSDIQRYMATLPPDFNGASEWNRLSSSLKELAAAYSTTFPMPEGQTARRYNDDEVKAAAKGVAKSADEFKKQLESSLKANASIDAATRSAAVQDVDTLKQKADKLASTVGDDKPASGEAQAVLDQAAKIRGFTGGHPPSPAAQSAWAPVQENLDRVAQAFGLSAR